ncbi:MAG: hypothetical protein Q8K12_15365 [Thiobacillus sp.]|nr:hypothetical protein [Thiobacillus sp.]
MTRRFIKFLLTMLAGGVFFLLLLEAILRLLPVNSGLRMQAVNRERPVMLALENQDYIYSYGWSLTNTHRGKTNNIGMPNSRDWVRGQPAVLVVGDSYIESLMNDYADTLQGKLERAFDPTPVFAMAHSGANAADYLRMMEFTQAQIPLRALVFRIDSHDFLESLFVEGGNEPGHNWFGTSGGNIFIGLQPYSPSALKEFARNFALARYLQRNLKFSPVQGIKRELRSSGKGLAEGDVHTERMTNVAAIEPVVEYFLRQLPRRSGVALADTIFIIDCDRKSIYGNFQVQTKGNVEKDGVRELFVSRARNGGAIVLDMCPAMDAYVRRTGQRLDFSPSDYHWNPAGHALVADAVIPELQRILQR